MNPNSADPIARPARPGARRRATQQSQQSQQSTATTHGQLTNDGVLPEEEAGPATAAIRSSDTEATVRLSSPPLPIDDNERVAPRLSSGTDIPSAEDEMTREDMEHATAGLTRDDLFLALRRAKSEMDRLDSVVSSQALEVESLQAAKLDLSSRLSSSEGEVQHLHNLIVQREARVDELTAEQEKMEDEVYKKLGLLERFKARVDEGDRKLEDFERKFAETTTASEKEREYYQNQEALLKSQNTRLSKENGNLKDEIAHLRDTVESLMEQMPTEAEATQSEQPSDKSTTTDQASSLSPQSTQTTPLRSPDRPVPRKRAPSSPTSRLNMQPLGAYMEREEASAVREELAQLKKTLASQDAALTELRGSLTKERNRNLELENDKTELESMLTGNTLERLMRASNGNRESHWDTSETSEAEASSAYSESEKAEDEDDVPDTPATPKHGKRSGKGGPRSSSAAYRSRKRSMDQIPEALGDELQDTSQAQVTDLKSELTRLRNENKNLTTYISKILNRILSMEGFERVLAADGMGGGMDSLRQARRQPRHSVLPAQTAGAAATEATKQQERKSRRQSAGIFGFTARVTSGGEPELPTSPQVETPSAGFPATRKAQGRASVDWRSMKLPWTSSTAAESAAANQQSSNLRAFTLSSSGSRLDVDPSGASLSPSQGGGVLTAAEAKKKSMDEDELERQRARALLEKQGHIVPDHQLTPISPRVISSQTTGSTGGASGGGGGFGAFFSRVLPSSINAAPSAPGQEQKMTSSAASSGASDTTAGGSDADLSLTESLPRRSQRAARSQARAPFDSDVDSSFASSIASGRTASTSLFSGQTADDLDVSAASGRVLPRRQASDATSSAASLANSSVAGDESYAFPRCEADDDEGATSAPPPPPSQQAAPPNAGGWRRALKRMSLLGGETPPPSLSVSQGGNAGSVSPVLSHSETNSQ